MLAELPTLEPEISQKSRRNPGDSSTWLLLSWCPAPSGDAAPCALPALGLFPRALPSPPPRGCGALTMSCTPASRGGLWHNHGNCQVINRQLSMSWEQTRSKQRALGRTPPCPPVQDVARRAPSGLPQNQLRVRCPRGGTRQPTSPRHPWRVWHKEAAPSSLCH